MNENEIMELITSNYSWEQVIYKIIALEGMDPWDLDIALLSQSFMNYLSKMRELDFKIPAKYIIIAAVLLKMKSDHLHFLDTLEETMYDVDMMDVVETDSQTDQVAETQPRIKIDDVNLPPKRVPVRKIMVTELIEALRKALRTRERRLERKARRRKDIHISEDRITQRIEELYKKIDTILAKIKKDEIKFSHLIEKWERQEIINTFLPLIHLDHENKVKCRQEKPFDEIYVKKVG